MTPIILALLIFSPLLVTLAPVVYELAVLIRKGNTL